MIERLFNHRSHHPRDKLRQGLLGHDGASGTDLMSRQKLLQSLDLSRSPVCGFLDEHFQHVPNILGGPYPASVCVPGFWPRPNIADDRIAVDSSSVSRSARFSADLSRRPLQFRNLTNDALEV
jgi:hypothetical protein